MDPDNDKTSSIDKRNLISIKGQTVTNADYRGFLALILVSAFAYVVITGSCEAIAALGPLTGSVVTYYFHSKSTPAQFTRDRIV
ncbi:MAG: hypothetical protein ACYCPW_03300 [Nitrososphaerales archaeon]